jgi:hypothetical protein
MVDRLSDFLSQARVELDAFRCPTFRWQATKTLRGEAPLRAAK